MKNNDYELNGWNEYKRLVMNDLSRLDHSIELLSSKTDAGFNELKSDLARIRTEIAEIKTGDRIQKESKLKITSYGFLGGSVILALIEGIKLALTFI